MFHISNVTNTPCTDSILCNFQGDVGHKEQHDDADQNAVRSKRVQRLPAVLDEDHHQQQEIVEKEDEQMQINKPGMAQVILHICYVCNM